MDPLQIIAAYYRPGSTAYEILVRHSERVAQKAVAAAGRVAHLNPDTAFIHEAAMLHDIGIFMTDSPTLGCYGPHPYVAHGVLGRDLLDGIGLGRHGRVCERHVGAGIRTADIRRQGLPLPVRDMRPVTLEEEIVCFADAFFSKNGSVDREKSTDQIVDQLARYGPDKVRRFAGWLARFDPDGQ